MTGPEFPRPQRLDRIGADTRVTVSAEPGEREALAVRFGLIAIGRLEASYHLRPEAGSVRASGHLSAEVVQPCVATGDPVPARIEEDFDLRFVPDGSPEGDEIELDEADCDTVFFTGGAIDLGEAAAETLALALDPFPRSPAAADALKQAGVLSEEEAGPFAALAALKGKLKE
ncbi:YceD family protein [Sphingomonas canadensis]|uniref:YceD family protein n=1 Tax=Sphingomonas canadensis TaxID=1219257 RepID=A0ABW3H6A3_9SPHN|nr:DUF177 domain-containing protein [Sphingomonas canadensis]MCW3835158.1 DUF177 domain-containing protein [Sphingomonas canadensis]